LTVHVNAEVAGYNGENVKLAAQSSSKVLKSLAMGSNRFDGGVLKTRILPISNPDLGHFENPTTLERWVLPTAGLESLQEAADHLKHGNVPVGFPTETVYGLGADATRSDAVKGIYRAKGRPSDNPLIVHVCDLSMLRSLLSSPEQMNGTLKDPVPECYKPLIKAFWPGPLTILLPNPTPSKLAKEVTAGLPSFGARMPSSPLALTLIHLAGVPLAAPSANASTRPSPTTAQHVLHDLDERIEIILDGGPCRVGVESTVVDGLCDPPAVLRPGGVSIDRIRECEGWEKVVKGYKDASEVGSHAPRAPGMKYKHYSPKAKVVLFEAGPASQERDGISLETWSTLSAPEKQLGHLGYESLDRRLLVGIISTKYWHHLGKFNFAKWSTKTEVGFTKIVDEHRLDTTNNFRMWRAELWREHYSQADAKCSSDRHVADLIAIPLGKDDEDIAHGLFSALRELDLRGVDVIYVEGIKDEGETIAAAVMNRLRKAATVIVI
jgi:L-threonylcarbamoyladenylate synthase